MAQEQLLFLNDGRKVCARGTAHVRAVANEEYHTILQQTLDAAQQATDALRASVSEVCAHTNERIREIAPLHLPVGSLLIPTDPLEPPPEEDTAGTPGAAETHRDEKPQGSDILSCIARVARALQWYGEMQANIWQNGTPRDVLDAAAFAAEIARSERWIPIVAIPLIGIPFRRGFEDILERAADIADAIEKRVCSRNTPSGTLGRIAVQHQTREALAELRSLVGEVGEFLDAPHEHLNQLGIALAAAQARVERAHAALAEHPTPKELYLPTTNERGQRFGSGGKRGMQRLHDAKVREHNTAAGEVKKSEGKFNSETHKNLRF